MPKKKKKKNRRRNTVVWSLSLSLSHAKWATTITITITITIASSLNGSERLDSIPTAGLSWICIAARDPENLHPNRSFKVFT